jgi:hypothetical protein
VGNLLLRVGFALSIVVVAIGMTAAATDTVARCDAGSLTVSSSDGAVACAPAVASEPVVAGYESVPGQAQQPTVAREEFSRDVTARVALATGAVLFSIFAILLSYRPRPGGVRTSHR